jgi:esterase/lipase
MKFFSGFALQNEQELFNFWLDCSNYCVAGFSYGAIKALEYTLNCKCRVDRLILLSPAFFNDKTKAFKKTQLIYFKKDTNSYIKNFLNNVKDGFDIDLTRYLKSATYEELYELLNYNWDIEKFKKIANNGTIIEVILAENDKIINSKKALEFFEDIATIYFIKDANHILKEVKK